MKSIFNLNLGPTSSDQRSAKTRMLVILIVGGLLILFASRAKHKKPLPPPLQAINVNQTENPSTPSSPVEQVSGDSQNALLKQAWGRDPFSESSAGLQSSEDKMQNLSGLFLTGIIIRSGKKVAIINRVFVQEGETIQGAQVVLIERTRVFLKRNDQEIILRMGAVW